MNKKRKINLFSIGNESEGAFVLTKGILYADIFFSKFIGDLPFFVLPVLFHSFTALKKTLTFS
jgi:hypothetical protein